MTKRLDTLAPPAPPETPVTSRLAGLDGLRAIAVLAVIGYHFLPAAAIGGFVGVDVFFVISGFLITGLLVRERHRSGRIDLPVFWMRRARRLLPALVLVVAVCSAAALVIGGDVLVGIGSQVLGAATFSSNWLFIAEGASYFDSTTPELFRNLWSLAVEEQFYLLWPLLLLLLLLIRSRTARIAIVVALALASGVGLWLLSAENTTRAYYGTDTHSFGLALGAALALLLESRFRGLAASLPRAIRIGLPIVGAVAIAGVVAIAGLLPADAPLTTQAGLAAAAVLTALAIAGSTAAGSWLGRALDVQPLRWIGERSYGLYLWHWPVLVLFVAALPAASVWWLAPAGALIVTVGAAALSYRFVELPIRAAGLYATLAGLVGRRRGIRIVSGTAVAALLVTVGLTGAAIAASPAMGEAELAIEQGRLAVLAAASQPAFAMGPRKPPPPATGDQITAVGDSVMLAAAPELQSRLPGIAIDATVSRQMFEVEDIVRAIINAGQLRPILVVGLGTNGWIEAQSLENVHDMLPRETLMIVVNVQAPREWVPDANAIIADFARRERGVELANWFDAIRPQIDVLASDEVHPGPTGSRIYADALVNALQRLAELPPLVDYNQYDSLYRPV